MTNLQLIHGWSTEGSSDRSTWKRVQQYWEGTKKGDLQGGKQLSKGDIAMRPLKNTKRTQDVNTEDTVFFTTKLQSTQRH